MSADSDDAEFVFYGTPLQQEDVTSRRHEFQKKDVASAAGSKSLPVWKQEAVDSEGRQRFHGAFTGGWSAGHYNSVGSAEGWAPTAFRSSRSDRASAKQQTVDDFLDEDEKEAAAKSAVAVAPEFDTFGSTAAERARQAADAEAADRSKESIPGLLPAELLAPVADSIGLQLLKKMGWRQGRGIGAVVSTGKGRGGSRWGRSAGTAPDPVPVFAPPSKEDRQGLGFDPFKGAEVFRAAKAARTSAPQQQQQQQQQHLRPGQQRQRGIAFGTGIGDEDDTYGMVDDYVSHEPVMRRSALHTQVAGSDEDEDEPRLLIGGRAQLQARLEGRPAPKQLAMKPASRGGGFALPGFIAADALPPPRPTAGFRVPPDFSGRHVFPPAPSPQGSGKAAAQERKRAELAAALAVYAAKARLAAAAGPGHRSAPLQEDGVAAMSDPLGGSHPGAAAGRGGAAAVAPAPAVPKRGADGGFASPAAAPGGTIAQAAPLAAGLMNAAAVLQTSFVRGTVQDMTPETGGLRKPQPTKPAPTAAAAPAPATAAGPSAVHELAAQPGGAGKPKRSVAEWRPMPLLCKRLNVADPYRGKPPPASEAATFQPWTLAELGQSRQGDGDYQALPLPPPPAADAAPQQQSAQPDRLPSAAAAQPPPWQQQQQQLPPPPPVAQPLAGKQDAAQEADDFLAGLGLPPPPAQGMPPPQQQAGQGAPPPSQQAVATQLPPHPTQPQVMPTPPKPMDLFKAVFEAPHSSDDEDSDAEEHPPAPQEPQQPGRGPPAWSNAAAEAASPMSLPPATAAAAAEHGSGQPAGGASDVGGTAAAAATAAAIVGPVPLQQTNGSAADGGSDGPPDAPSRSIIEAALKRLRNGKDKKKHRKKKEQEKEKEKERRPGKRGRGEGDGSGSDASDEPARKHKHKKAKHKSKKG